MEPSEAYGLRGYAGGVRNRTDLLGATQTGFPIWVNVGEGLRISAGVNARPARNTFVRHIENNL